MVGLYVHVPFCAKKCPYCDFYSVPFRQDTAEEYFTCLLAEIDAAPDGIFADTLYFGGGTPLLAGPNRLGRVIEKARQKFHLQGEITVEANPFSFPQAVYDALFATGCNRISFGMQSMQQAELHALGRSHTPKQMQQAVQQAKQAGFTNISADLMLGVPYQTPETLSDTLNRISELDIPHVSAYLLTVEPGTPFSGSPEHLLCPDEDLAAELYLQVVKQLERMGLQQYEISNFARPGFESKHNLKYWRCEEYLGFGAAAHSFFKGKRYAHGRDIVSYCKCPANDLAVTEEQAGGVEEQLMLALRLNEGIDLSRLQEEISLLRLLEAADPLLRGGFLQLNRQHLRMTPRGFLVSNQVIATLLETI